MPLTKVGAKYQVTIPRDARKAIEIEVGDFVESRVTRGEILLRPKVVIDKTRQMVDKRLFEGLEDIKRGRTYGPFSSVELMISSLHGARSAKRSKKTHKAKTS